MQSIFGTDGIRGIFDKELTYSLAYKVGYALGVLTKTNNPILLGRDTRVSGYILLEAISRGINAAGKEFIYLGICPTPGSIDDCPNFLRRKVGWNIKFFNTSAEQIIRAKNNISIDFWEEFKKDSLLPDCII